MEPNKGKLLKRICFLLSPTIPSNLRLMVYHRSAPLQRFFEKTKRKSNLPAPHAFAAD